MKKIVSLNYSILFCVFLITITAFSYVYAGENLSSDSGIETCKELVKNNPDSAEAQCKLADVYIDKYLKSENKEKKWLFLAMKAARQAQKIDAASPLPHISLAILYSVQGKSDNADAEIDKAIELDPNNKRVKELIKARERAERMKVLQEARDLFIKGEQASDPDEKISYYTRAIKLDPDYPEVYKNRGRTYRKKKDYDRAIADYKKAIELNNKDPQTFNRLGYAYYLKKQNNKAIKNYSKALELDSNYEKAYSNRARAYYNNKDYDRAIADYSKSLALKPDDDNALAMRGLCYRKKEDYDRAVNDYNASIDIDPTDAQIYNNRGVAYYLKGEIARAIADYKKALELKPGYKKAEENLDLALRKQRILAPAKTEKKPKPKKISAKDYNNRGVEYHKKKDINSAIDSYSKAIELKPNYALAYYNRGNSWYALKKYDRAKADYTAAIRLDPDNPSSYVNRSRIWVKKKDYQRASKDIKTAIRLDPDNKKYKRALKKIEKR